MKRTAINVLHLMERCQEEDEDAAEKLHLEKDFHYAAPPPFDSTNVTRSQLSQEITEMIFFAEAAHRMKHPRAESVARTAIAHMRNTYVSLFGVNINTDNVLHGPDLAMDMRELAQDSINCMDKLHLMEALEKHRPMQGTLSESEKDSDYEPSRDDQPKDESTGQSSEEDHPPRKRRAQQPTLATPPKIAPSKASSPAKSPGPRSHKTVKKCPLPDCSFNGHDLRRHLMVHVKKDELAEERVQRVLNIARTGESQRGKQRARKGKTPTRGRQRKWCPVPLCYQIIVDVGQHLSYPGGHAIKKDSRECQRLMKMARPYTGLAEIEESLVPPPPKIVEAKPQKTTSPAASDEDEIPAGPPASSVASNTAASAAGPSHGAASTSITAASLSGLVASNGATAAAAGPSSDAACSNAAATLEYAEEVIRPVHRCKAAAVFESSEDEASDGQESSIGGSAAQYYSAKNPKTKRHQWLVLFFEYLSRPSAGDKKTSIRLQHVSQMRKILEAISPDGDDITCLVHNEGDVVWSQWVKPHLEAGTKKPGTLISYLTSYEKFLGLVTHQRFNKSAPPLHPDHFEVFANVLKDLKGWRSVVDSKSYAVKNKRVVDETEGLLTLEELDAIKSSSAYNQAVRLVLQAGRGKELTNKEFILVRDLLITKFSLDTGTRPGPLNNATLEEFQKGTVKDDCKVMLVARHKRAKDGPAICPMLPELH